jgi:hypothetical protein
MEGFRLGEMGHRFTKVAEWNVRGSDVTGEMHGCRECGLVLVNDRRGALLIAPGGLGSMHKRIFPCQRPPRCKPATDAGQKLQKIYTELTGKNDPRFRIFR